MSFNPLKKEQIDFLKDLIYEKKVFLGRDRLFKYILEKYPEQNISRRAIADYQSKQPVYQVFRQRKAPTSTRPTVSTKVNSIIQIDLIDYSNQPQKRFKYILNIIDVLSRKVWLIPITNKTAKIVESKLKPLIEKYHFKVICSDNGLEFSIDFAKLGVKHIKGQSYTPQQQSIVERSNGSIKSLLKKSMYHDKSYNWLKFLPIVEEIYNDSINRSTGKTPNQVFESNETDQLHVVEKIHNAHAKNYKDVDRFMHTSSV